MEKVLFEAETGYPIGINDEIAVGTAAYGKVVVYDCGVACVECIDAAGVVEQRVLDSEHRRNAAIVGGMNASVEAREGRRCEILFMTGQIGTVVAIGIHLEASIVCADA